MSTKTQSPDENDEDAVPDAVSGDAAAVTPKARSEGTPPRVNARVNARANARANTPVSRGRPRLSAEERLRREEWDADKKATRALALRRGLAAVGRSGSHSTDVEGLLREAAPKKRRRAKRGDAKDALPTLEETVPELSPVPLSDEVPAAPLSVAQRALGVGFGEAGEALEDAVPLRHWSGPLPENVKRFIVIRNACDVPPRETIAEVKQVFGVLLTSSQVARYDPTKAAGQTLREDYKRLYAEMKCEAQMVFDCLGVGDRDWRLTALHTLCVKAMEEGDGETALRIMKLVHREECARTDKDQKVTPRQPALREKLRTCDRDKLPPIHPRQDPLRIQPRMDPTAQKENSTGGEG